MIFEGNSTALAKILFEPSVNPIPVSICIEFLCWSFRMSIYFKILSPQRIFILHEAWDEKSVCEFSYHDWTRNTKGIKSSFGTTVFVVWCLGCRIWLEWVLFSQKWYAFNLPKATYLDEVDCEISLCDCLVSTRICQLNGTGLLDITTVQLSNDDSLSNV